MPTRSRPAHRPTARVWIRRAYEPSSRNDGYRVLIDRLWPRGVTKEVARLDEWAHDLAPSDDLRRWFGHEPARWEEFRRRYRKELTEHRGEVARLVERAKRGRVTLVYGAHDQMHNDAVVLREVIASRLERASGS